MWDPSLPISLDACREERMGGKSLPPPPKHPFQTKGIGSEQGGVDRFLLGSVGADRSGPSPFSRGGGRTPRPGRRSSQPRRSEVRVSASKSEEGRREGKGFRRKRAEPTSTVYVIAGGGGSKRMGHITKRMLLSTRKGGQGPVATETPHTNTR